MVTWMRYGVWWSATREQLRDHERGERREERRERVERVHLYGFWCKLSLLFWFYNNPSPSSNSRSFCNPFGLRLHCPLLLVILYINKIVFYWKEKEKKIIIAHCCCSYCVTLCFCVFLVSPCLNNFVFI